MAIPKLVAFDLDATLWYPEMYMISGPPFQVLKGRKGRPVVRDCSGEEVELLGDAWSILNELATHDKWANTEVAYVSMTDMPAWAKQCLKLFELECGITLHELATHHEVYPGNKKTHFRRIHERSGIDYEHMLFFDDLSWNVQDCASLGVVGVRTPNGLTAQAWRLGLEKYAARHC